LVPPPLGAPLLPVFPQGALPPPLVGPLQPAIPTASINAGDPFRKLLFRVVASIMVLRLRPTHS
jgi:hypothetical protein